MALHTVNVDVNNEFLALSLLKKVRISYGLVERVCQ